jgi:DNA-binding transcriptional MocR family regulator
VSYRVLQLAERYDFIIVEDDVCADLDMSKRRSLACMDQLNRVVYITSYSKSISPKLRVGFVVADADAIEDMTQIKMMTGLTSCEFTERLALELLNEGRYRKQIKVLKEQVASARESVAHRLRGAGLELFADADCGLFIWAKHPAFEDSLKLCNMALQSNLLLAPGHLFMVGGQSSPWIRFNVGFSDNHKLYEYLAQVTPE